MQAKLREFGITDEERDFEKSNLHHACIYEAEQSKQSTVLQIYYTVLEQGCELILLNGIVQGHFGSNKPIDDDSDFSDYALEI